MEYAIGKPGRIIAAKLTEGEQLYESLESLAAKEGIKSAAVFITGGIRAAEVVAGPKSENPIVPDKRTFNGPGETLGVGTIYRDDEDKPKMHIHTGMGRGGEMIVGCPRGGASIFLILEVTIIEFEGINALRKPQPDSGLKLLTFE